MVKIQCPGCRRMVMKAEIVVGEAETKCRCGQIVKVVDRNRIITIDKK